ncbi:MAG: RNase adapter RapZ [Wenzhouxiangellaceae bacterium]
MSSSRLVVVSGLSGSGKSIALRALEDIDYFCIDNLPAGLLPQFASQASHYSRAAVGLDVRAGGDALQAFDDWLRTLREAGWRVQVIYLTASTSRLMQRFSETRRRHPLTTHYSLSQAIATEEQLLQPLRDAADWLIDTSDTNVHELRHRLWKLIDDDAPGPLVIKSFAYRNGVPGDADLLFDARCLPNPHWQPQLRPLSGLDAAIQEYLDDQPEAQALLQDIDAWLQRWLPRYQQQQRGQLTVAIGCTGGRHRSVYLVERLADRQRDQHTAVIVHHRDVT